MNRYRNWRAEREKTKKEKSIACERSIDYEGREPEVMDDENESNEPLEA